MTEKQDKEKNDRQITCDEGGGVPAAGKEDTETVCDEDEPYEDLVAEVYELWLHIPSEYKAYKTVN